MKKSNVGPVVATSPKSIEKFCDSLKAMFTKEFQRYSKPGYGVNPVLDMEKMIIVDYEPLGDPENMEQSSETFKIFGKEVTMPIVTSKFEVSSNGNNRVEEEIKSINYSKLGAEGQENLLNIIETGYAAAKISLFYAKYMEIPLRGLTPEIKDIQFSRTDERKPQLGRAFLDYWFANPSVIASKSQKAYEEYKTEADELHLHMAAYRCYLYARVVLYREMMNIVKRRSTSSEALSSVVSKKAFTPEVSDVDFEVVNNTHMEENRNKYGEIDGTYFQYLK